MNTKLAFHKNRSRKYVQAKDLRKSASIVEKILRNELRKQTQLFDVAFRHQYPVDPYIVDFICLPARLIVEIDGMSHDSTPEQDVQRQLYLEQQGFEVLRFANDDIMRAAPAIAETMCVRARERLMALWAARKPIPEFAKANSTLPQGKGISSLIHEGDSRD